MTPDTGKRDEGLHGALAAGLLLVVGLLLAAAGSAPAGESGAEFAPEIDAFVRLEDRTRLFLAARLKQGLTQGGNDGEVGVHVDVTLTPVLRRRLRYADWERDRYLWMRIGYQLIGSLDEPDSSTLEHRGIFEMTARVPLPLDLWLVNRGRADLRDVGGDVSARGRYRLGVEREVQVAGVALVPYAKAEVFYDSRFGTWNRQIYETGVEIEITRHWRIEPYYARQEDQSSSLAHLDRVGLILKYYR